MRALLDSDRDVVVWSLTPVEVTSALWRRARAGSLDESTRTAACDALAVLESAWNVALDIEQVGARARRLLASHPLRAADACQLAAALVVSRERPTTLPFVTLDERLAEAARREGFSVVPAAE
jgi:hypothetical protein